MEEDIPTPVCAVIGRVLGRYHRSHSTLDNLFEAAGAPGEPPDANCVRKGVRWLKRASKRADVNGLRVLGKAIAEFMEVDDEGRFGELREEQAEGRKKILEVLEKYGLSYAGNGRIHSSGVVHGSMDLEEIIRHSDLEGLNKEYQRAVENVEADPPAALTAACAIFEAFCHYHIEKTEGLELPKKKSAKPLWQIVHRDLELHPARLADDDLKQILTGLASIMHGFSDIRTHMGSAHGGGEARYRYKIKPRHARLAVNASHTLVLFLMEKDREAARSKRATTRGKVWPTLSNSS